MTKMYDFSDLQQIVKKLRSEDGCPWDRIQTHESLEQCMIEEAYEAVEGIHLLKETGDGENLCEELGDVLLQVIFHSQLAQEEEQFTLDDVIQGISEKMIRRHPHVFSDGQAKEADQARQNWEEIKKEEKKGKRDQRSELESVPRAFPALIRASKVQKKLDRGGYRPMEPVENMCRQAGRNLEQLSAPKRIPEEEAGVVIGDLLYQICQIAGRYGINPEEVLAARTEQEIRRYAPERKG